MVRTINTLTIGQYNLYLKTGRKKYLMSVPLVFLFKAKIDKLISEINEGLQGDEVAVSAMRKDIHQIKSIRKAQYLTSLYQGAYILLVSKPKIEALGGKSADSKSLEFFKSRIKEKAGFELNEASDLLKLKDKINHLNDKYSENFTVSAEEKGLTYSEIIMIVFKLMGFDINYNMLMTDFFDLKKKAEEIGKKTSD